MSDLFARVRIAAALKVHVERVRWLFDSLSLVNVFIVSLTLSL